MKRIYSLLDTPLRKIAFVVALHNAWFWVPIWVLYYRRFMTYEGVALLEGLSMGMAMAMIIPGGLAADWLGRKRMLILASICSAVGSLAAGLSQTFGQLAPSILLLSFGGSMYQSSIQAMMYDTLKMHGREYQYDRVLGKFITVQMVSCALASTIGGLLYSINVQYPWFAGTVVYGIGILACLRLQEPTIETSHDSFRQFIKEAGKGAMLLFKKEWIIAVPLLCIGIFLTTDSSGLWDIQAVEFGFSSSQLGVLLTLTYLALAVTSSFLPRFVKKWNTSSVLVGSSLLFLGFWFFSSFVMGTSGGILLILRSIVSVLFDIKASVVWNKMIPTSIRATTLSTISIIRGVPYIAVSWGIGMAMDTFGVHVLVRIFAAAMGIGVLLMAVLWKRYRLHIASIEDTT